MIESSIKLIGMFGLVGLILYLGYLFYDKNTAISFILLVIGIGASIYIIINEIEFKKHRHKEPWNFEKYKGE